jgi:hypothetical protein
MRMKEERKKETVDSKTPHMLGWCFGGDVESKGTVASSNSQKTC